MTLRTWVGVNQSGFMFGQIYGWVMSDIDEARSKSGPDRLLHSVGHSIVTRGAAICAADSGARFVIGVLQRIDLGLKACQGLILAPTRELANQIQKAVAP